MTDLIENRNIPVCVVEEDVLERGIAKEELLSGINLISRKKLPEILDEYEVISHW